MRLHISKMVPSYVLLSALFIVATSSCSVSQAPGAPDLPTLMTRVETVSERFVRGCMVSEGFTYFATVSADRAVPFFDYANAYAQAKAIGTGQTQIRIIQLDGSFGKRMKRAQEANPNHQYIESLSPADNKAYTQALNGSRYKPGCRLQAQRKLESLERDIRTILDARQQQRRNISPMVDQLTKWAVCMRRQGYRYRTVEDMRVDVLTRIEDSGDDLRKLQNEVLAYDRHVGLTSLDCWTSTGNGNGSDRLRLERKLARSDDHARGDLNKRLDELDHSAPIAN